MSSQKNFVQAIFSIVKPRIIAFAGTVGLISDILSPVAPFASYVFITAVVCSIVLTLIYFLKVTIRQKITGAISFSLATTMVSGTIFAFQPEETDSGLLADIVPQIANIQKQMGILKDDIEDVKATTQRIEKKADALIVEMAGIVDRFEAVSSNKGLVNNPTKPEEFYHNARLSSLSGNFLQARENYEKFLDFNLEFIDAHLDYQKLLVSQDGLINAQKVYGEDLRVGRSRSKDLAKILLLTGNEKIEGLKNFTKSNKDFGPAFLFLANALTEFKGYEETIAEKKYRYEVLNELIKLEEAGNYLKFFLDQDLAADLMAESKAEWRSLSRDQAILITNPIVLNGDIRFDQENPKGVFYFFMSSAEPALEYFLKTDKGDQSLGFSDSLNAKTGKPWPIHNGTIDLFDASQDEIKIEASYLDGSGVKQGPFILQLSKSNILKNQLLRGLENRKFYLRVKEDTPEKSTVNIGGGLEDYECVILSISIFPKGKTNDERLITNDEQSSCYTLTQRSNETDFETSLKAPFDVSPNDFPKVDIILSLVNGVEKRLELPLPKFQNNYISRNNNALLDKLRSEIRKFTGETDIEKLRARKRSKPLIDIGRTQEAESLMEKLVVACKDNIECSVNKEIISEIKSLIEICQLHANLAYTEPDKRCPKE